MVNRILAGKHPDTGVVGLWISKATKDARTSTNPDDFLFDPSKYLARPFVKFTVGAFARGAFQSTQTFSDGSKADKYLWSADFFHGLGFVPLYTVQVGGDIEEPWADGAKIAIPLANQGIVGARGVAMFRYLASDPSKTPIAGSITAGYDVATQTYNPQGVSRSVFSVFRVPLF